MGQIQDNADGTVYFVGDNFDDFSHGLAAFLAEGCSAEIKTEQNFTALLRCPDALPPAVPATGLVGANTPEGQQSPAEGNGDPVVTHPDDGTFSLVHDSTVDEVEDLIADGTLTQAEVREAETAEGGKNRKGVLALTEED